MLATDALKEVLSSSLNNIDGEGYAGRWQDAPLDDLDRVAEHYWNVGPYRYNLAGPYASFIEMLAASRVAEAFTDGTDVDPQEVHVNLQALSGSVANLAVFNALLEPGDSIVSLSLTAGGHLSHGARFHITGKTYDVHSVSEPTAGEEFDVASLIATVDRVRPRMVIVGSSSYPHTIPWAAIRSGLETIAPRPVFVADVAHFAGPIAAGFYPNPLPHADVVSLVSYKTLAGPRLGVLLTRDPTVAAAIDRSVFPGLQSSPNLAQMAALAFAAGFARTAAFRDLIANSISNARHLGNELTARGHALAFDGTSTHMLLVKLDRRTPPLAVQMERHGILLNANMLPSDTSPREARGLRLGLVGVTQRGLRAAAVPELAGLLDDAATRLGEDQRVVDRVLEARVQAFVQSALV